MAFSFNEFEEIWFEENVSGDDVGLECDSFYGSSVKRIYCNSRKPPVICVPEDVAPDVMERGCFPFANDDNGIVRLDDLTKIRLYVPAGFKEEYVTDPYWGHFDIEEMDFSAGVAEVPAEATGIFKAVAGEGLIEFEAVEDVDINVYDASGRSVAIARLGAGDNRTLPLPAGIYIAVASGHSVKVAVR